MRHRPAAAAIVAAAFAVQACKSTDSARVLEGDGLPPAGAEAEPLAGVRHVHLVHLDGFRPDVFKALLDAGRLPHFAWLLERGRVSYNASTVDKTETFKVIQAYLTSRIDTEITAWWQWDRRDFQFHNYWMDPVEVANYALGLEFPLTPTIFDVLAAKKSAVTAGFSLHRRSVPFNDYTRNYVEGYNSVSNHTYFDQAHATVDAVRELYKRKAEGDPRTPGEAFPVFSNSVIAPADEFGHLEGVVGQDAGGQYGDGGEFCMTRPKGAAEKKEPRMHWFNVADSELSESLAQRYFTKVEKKSGKTQRLCLALPEIDTRAEPVEKGGATAAPARRAVLPNYALGMLEVDMGLGRLLETMASIKLGADGKTSYAAVAPGSVLAGGALPADSLLEQTAFVMTGDHGLVDSKHMMASPNADHPDPYRAAGSIDRSLIAWLDEKLALQKVKPASPVEGDAEIGVDDTELPAELAAPHKDKSWQSPEIQALTSEAEAWAKEFAGEIKLAVKKKLHRKYWYLYLLWSVLIDPRLDEATAEVTPKAIDTLAKIYLRGEPKYVEAERAALRAFYAKHVRLVYGGGAKNNMELFLPTKADGGYTWDKRPSYDEIVAYKGGSGSAASVIDALKTLPSASLIFVRKQNDQLAASGALPAEMEIEVQDREGHKGLITVKRDSSTRQLLFGYRALGGEDPLGYGALAQGAGTVMTFNEWNDASIAAKHVYHNVPGGIGAYLYSRNPSIGDVTVMAAQGWNFGDNAGGHGGTLTEEKLTMMLVSAPGLTPGELKAVAPYATEDGVVKAKPHLTSPTVLDVAPSILAWLGHGRGALSAFAKDSSDAGFKAHLQRWIDLQQQDILGNVDHIDNLNAALAEAGFSSFQVSQFKTRLTRLLRFLPKQAPELGDLASFREDGNLLLVK